MQELPPEESTPDVDLRKLTGHAHYLNANATVERALEEFTRLHVDFLAVIDNGSVAGGCARRDLAHALSSRYGFALHARKTVRDLLMPSLLRVVTGLPITDVFKAATARGEREFFDDVLLVDGQGRYLGMIPTRTLMRMQTDFLLRNILTLEDSQREIAERNRQVEEDLRMARNVQHALLPSRQDPIQCGGHRLEVAHRFQAAGSLSGDFFDIARLPNGSAGVLVCDVMGHGVRSALITAMVRAIWEELRPLASDPGKLLTRLNHDLTHLLRQAGEMIFVTAAYFVVDTAAGRLRYAQAGHPTPWHWHAQEKAMRPFECPPESAGPALGLMDETEFTNNEEPFAPGDRLIAFTDGLVEFSNPRGEEFGLDRLTAVLQRLSDRTLEDTLDGVIREARNFGATAMFGDDVCIVAAELKTVA